MELTKNIIAFSKGYVCPVDAGCENHILVSTLQSNIMAFGYIFDQDVFNSLAKADKQFIIKFHDEIITYIKYMTGGLVNYTPLYKNFPEEVMSKSDFELYFNAIVHYLSNGEWEPSTVEYEKPINFENIKYTVLKLLKPEDFGSIFTNLVSANQSLTYNDREIIKWFINNNEKYVIPAKIPFKETLCYLAGLGIDNLPIKTTTDVLRIAVYMSGGDVSLPKVPKKYKGRIIQLSNLRTNHRDTFKFKKFTRKERKFILNLLENTNCDITEMSLYKERWYRLGEILHPFEYKNKYPKSYKAFDLLRNENVRSWYSQVDGAFKVSLEEGLKVLSTRSGEFMRKIDSIIRKNPNDINLIMKYFSNSVNGSSNKVIYELYKHFENRLQQESHRSITIKGTRIKTTLPVLPALNEELVKDIQNHLLLTLKNKFSTLDSLGECYIDEDLKKIPLPTNMRSINTSLKPIIRGMRISIGNKDTKVIRPYVHWFDEYGNEDLDLSSTFVGKDVVSVLSFSNLKVGNSCHSGDIRHRRGNCAEYIDVDIKNAIELGYQYVLIDVRNFNDRSLETVNTVFGIMEREFPESNNIWLPETISNSQKLESKSTNTLISILDLNTLEYLMVDMDSNGSVTASGDIANTLKMIEEFVKPPKFSVYDLLKLHVEVRGLLVDTLTENTTHFKFEDFSTSYENIFKFMGE